MTKKNNKKGTRARDERKRGNTGARSSELTRARQNPSSELSTSSISLPLKDQHLLLSSLQCVLEEMCEAFGAKHYQCQSLLEKHGWTEPKSLELHSWCRVILNCPDKLSSLLEPVHEEERRHILNTCANIRHSAVHRLPQDAESIFRSLDAGIGLAKMHRDATVVQYIQNLRSDFQTIIKDTWSRKHALQDKLQTRLEQISKEQARLKQTAMRDAKTEVDNCVREAGARLVDCVNAMSHKMASAAQAISDRDDFSEPDIDKILLEAEKAGVVPFAKLPG
ncbi:hypothetical protein ABOM_002755 [Aspergillus bombycis]|uniref:Ubiquinol-cytochrome-c reductase cytochrome c1 n=1 Tax=Aspergillus bombycis TaxID=109264 RepID=A0A1F8A8E4_9EURO|nr:hypothetical protein ABOM_002755 [Aspergillus bombycis]OGM47994.1 hypothetical protein ABOM_002755 [Aspergillus bombycis]